MEKDDDKPFRLLLAEDSPEVASRLDEALRAIDGLEIIGPIADGDVALDLFHQFEPESAILDLQLPGLSGLEILMSIRERDKKCLVILFTLHDSQMIRDACIAAGANHFFRKGCEMDIVIEAVVDFMRADKNAPAP